MSSSRASSKSSGFWNLPDRDREQAMQEACDREGVSDFWDLDPDQRRRAYDEALGTPGDREEGKARA